MTPSRVSGLGSRLRKEERFGEEDADRGGPYLLAVYQQLKGSKDCHVVTQDNLNTDYVRCLARTAKTSKHCTSLQKCYISFNQWLQKIRFNGTGRYHGTIPITVKELCIY
jgi:hypothetical protein